MLANQPFTVLPSSFPSRAIVVHIEVQCLSQEILCPLSAYEPSLSHASGIPDNEDGANPLCCPRLLLGREHDPQGPCFSLIALEQPQVDLLPKSAPHKVVDLCLNLQSTPNASHAASTSVPGRCLYTVSLNSEPLKGVNFHFGWNEPNIGAVCQPLSATIHPRAH